MRRPARFVLPCLLLLAFAAPATRGADDAVTPSRPVDLFNGRDLAGWTVYAREGSTGNAWSVADGVIRCSGDPAGYLRTENRYRNYRLTVQWRWTGPSPGVDSKGQPRRRNSGVLVHMQEPDAIWPKSLEAQLMEDNAGDFYVIGGVETTEWRRLRDEAVAAAGPDEEARKRALGNRRTPKAQASAEKPINDWNTYTIVCRDDTVTLTVNGVRQNHATGVTVAAGHICLQSEGAPIDFRHVKLEPLD